MSDDKIKLLPTKKKELELVPISNVVSILETLLADAKEGKVIEFGYSALYRDQFSTISPIGHATTNMIGSTYQYAQQWMMSTLQEFYNDQIHLSKEIEYGGE